MERFKLGPEPQTLEELRRLQGQMPPRRVEPRPARTEDRSRVDLPVQLLWKTSDGRQHVLVAQAREVSATSVFVELEPNSGLSSPELLLQLEPGQEISLCAVARVTRVESKDGKVGVAMIIEDYRYAEAPPTAAREGQN